jgi:hypothetical protein
MSISAVPALLPGRVNNRGPPRFTEIPFEAIPLGKNIFPKLLHPLFPYFLDFTLVTDRTFGSAELPLCGLAEMTELLPAEHRTFFVLHLMPMASFRISFCLMTHVLGVIIGH